MLLAECEPARWLMSGTAADMFAEDAWLRGTLCAESNVCQRSAGAAPELHFDETLLWCSASTWSILSADSRRSSEMLTDPELQSDPSRALTSECLVAAMADARCDDTSGTATEGTGDDATELAPILGERGIAVAAAAAALAAAAAELARDEARL